MSIRMLCAASALAIFAGCAQFGDDPAESPSFVAATLGYDAYKSGDLVTAETRFEEALSAEPDNPYALLGLGAVRENTGDLDGARRLYDAARGTGGSAPANYTYITEQRLERATNIDVAALAQENIDRLTVLQASLAAPAPAAVVAYGDGIEEAETFDPVPASYTDTVVSPAQGDYREVGSYDSYIASLGGVLADPVATGDFSMAPALDATSYDGLVYGTETVEAPAYAKPVSIATEYVAFAPVDATYSAPVDYADTYAEPATYRETTPYYDAPLAYADVSAPPVYAPVASIAPPEPVTVAGPVGRVVEYGTPLGGPTDLVPPRRPRVSDVAGLVFLD